MALEFFLEFIGLLICIYKKVLKGLIVHVASHLKIHRSILSNYLKFSTVSQETMCSQACENLVKSRGKVINEPWALTPAPNQEPVSFLPLSFPLSRAIGGGAIPYKQNI